METDSVRNVVLHPLVCEDGVSLPVRMNNPFYYQPHPLAVKAAGQVQTELASHEGWAEEIGKGKMFGVLVVSTADGDIGFLKAFSGQLQGTFSHVGWVPPVYDFLSPDGSFIAEEKRISLINAELTQLSDDDSLRDMRRRMQAQDAESRSVIEAMRAEVAEKKVQRDRKRIELGVTTPEMIRESQYMKASLKRLIKDEERKLQPLREKLQEYDRRMAFLRTERRRLSEESQRKLFDYFIVVNGNGAKASLSELFRDTVQKVPPSGSGECCAPKLLNYALLNGLRPLALAEFWWGESPRGLVRNHLSYFPACSGKCKPILDFMLQGVDVEPNALLVSGVSAEIDVVYEDDWLVIVDKPSGVLSAPGRGEASCVVDLLLQQRCDLKNLYNVNRLDMQTSGLLLLAKTLDAQVLLRKMFEKREVEKTYEAVLDGEYYGSPDGTISLPLSADYIHRPCQKVDHQGGKEAITHYYILRVREGYTYLRLHPVTGRTHQLRVHCAHREGLGIPIVGDALYGTRSEQMLLRCVAMRFTHPFTEITLNLKVPSFDCMLGI